MRRLRGPEAEVDPLGACLGQPLANDLLRQRRQVHRPQVIAVQRRRLLTCEQQQLLLQPDRAVDPMVQPQDALAPGFGVLLALQCLGLQLQCREW